MALWPNNFTDIRGRFPLRLSGSPAFDMAAQKPQRNLAFFVNDVVSPTASIPEGSFEGRACILAPLVGGAISAGNSTGKVALAANGALLSAKPMSGAAGIDFIAGPAVAEVSTFTFLSDPTDWGATAPNGKYFTIGVPTGQAYVWFARDSNGDDPAPSGYVRGILIDPGDISYGTPAANRNAYAGTLVAVLGSDPDLSATQSGDTVTITSRATGVRADIALGTLLGSDASVAVTTQGRAAVPANLSLVVSLSGESTLTLTSADATLSLTIGLSGEATWTLTPTGALGMIVPVSGTAPITLTGTADLKGLLSMSGDSSSFTELSPESLARAVWSEVIEHGYTAEQLVRLLTAMAAGKSSGFGTATATFRNLADSKARLTATLDGSGNRTAVTVDPT